MFNRIELIGRLGQDAEVRYLEGGAAICSFSMATSERWKGKDGEPQERTTWFRVVLFGKIAASGLPPFLTKGKLVHVEGKMVSRQWMNKEGASQTAWEVNGQNVILLSGGQVDEEPRQTNRNENRGALVDATRDQDSSPMESLPGGEDDIPF